MNRATPRTNLARAHRTGALLAYAAHPRRLKPRDAAARELLRVRRVLRLLETAGCGRRRGGRRGLCCPAGESPLAAPRVGAVIEGHAG